MAHSHHCQLIKIADYISQAILLHICPSIASCEYVTESKAVIAWKTDHPIYLDMIQNLHFSSCLRMMMLIFSRTSS